MSISIKELNEYIKNKEKYAETQGKYNWVWKQGYDCAIYQLKLLIKSKKIASKKSDEKDE